jgi:hypothetical protein
MQAFLFESNVQSIADETTGPITYYPAVISRELAEKWFAAIRAQADWHSGMRMMYERMVDVPRLHGHYAITIRRYLACCSLHWML